MSIRPARISDARATGQDRRIFRTPHLRCTHLRNQSDGDWFGPIVALPLNGMLSTLTARRGADARGSSVHVPQSVVGAVLVAIGVTVASGDAQETMFSGGQGGPALHGQMEPELLSSARFAAVRDGDAWNLMLDSGTGALTTAVAAVAPTSPIVGIDPLALLYVAFAETRHPEDRIRFEVGDAQRLRFANGSFDLALSFWLNFIPQPSKALDEMIRVTRPEGPLRPLSGTTRKGWKCCGCSGTRRSRSLLRRIRAMSGICPSVGREILARSGVNTGCWTSQRRRLRSKHDFPPSMMYWPTHSSTSKGRPATTWRSPRGSNAGAASNALACASSGSW